MIPTTASLCCCWWLCRATRAWPAPHSHLPFLQSSLFCLAFAAVRRGSHIPALENNMTVSCKVSWLERRLVFLNTADTCPFWGNNPHPKTRDSICASPIWHVCLPLWVTCCHGCCSHLQGLSGSRIHVQFPARQEGRLPRRGGKNHGRKFCCSSSGN